MTIVGVVFDMDGLMLDTEPIYQDTWQQAAAEQGCRLDDELYSTFFGRPVALCEADLVERFGDGFHVTVFAARWRELWRATARERGIPWKRGLESLLSFLEDRRMPTAIATSSAAALADFTLGCAGLAGRFQVVVTGDQVVRGKPAPDIYLEAARRLSLDPTRCVALEDSDAGVLAASAAGMVTLCVPDMKAPSEAATRAAARVLDSLDDAVDVIAGLLAAGTTPPRPT